MSAQLELKAIRHRDIILARMKELGFKTKRQKRRAFSITEITYLGAVWDSTTMQAQLSPARIESILMTVKRVKEGRSLTTKQFQVFWV